jgi:hypothetical protein
MTCDFPLFTLPITWDLPMSVLLMSRPSLVLHTCNTRSSVSTGWIIFPLWSTGTLILWNLRLVLLGYCSWFSTLISSSEILLNRALISASCSFFDRPCSKTFCSSLMILADCSVNCLECPSIRGLMLRSTHGMCYWLFDEFMLFSWRFSYVDTKLYNSPLLHLNWKRSFFRWRRFHLQGLKTGLRNHLRVLPIQIYRCDVESTINVTVEVSFKFAR